MSIIIQAGHNSSFSNELMEELYLRGLKRPLNSYSYRLSVNDITHMLVQALSKGDEIGSKSKIADSLIIDFQLNNLDDKTILGWEDEKNLVILDFFKESDLEGTISLIFDHPKYIFKNINFNELSINIVDQMLTEWLFYHRNLLDFYEKNKSICLLLEGKASFENFNEVKRQLTTLKPNIKLKSGWQVADNRSNEVILSELDSPVELLSNLLFKHYPEIIQVYNTLLDLASVKSSQPIYKSKNPSKDELFLSLKVVGIELSENSEKLKEQNNLLLQDLEKAQKKINDLQEKLLFKGGDNIENHTNLEVRNKKLMFQLAEAYESIEKISTEGESNKYLKRDDKMLFEENPSQVFQDRKLKNSLESVSSKNIKVANNEYIGLYGAEQRVKQDLPYRIGFTIVSSTKSHKGALLLPLHLLKEYGDYKKNENKIKNLPPLEAYQDRSKGEKAKKHLSYQLGKRVVSISSSPINLFKAPFGMLKDIYSFKKNN